jgi:hypothetical protein
MVKKRTGAVMTAGTISTAGAGKALFVRAFALAALHPPALSKPASTMANIRGSVRA